jgi:hypothetical protein
MDIVKHQARILELWALNKTTREIAAEIGTTKNSICGFLNRLREKGVAVERRPGGFYPAKQKNQKIAKIEKVTKLRERRPKIVAPIKETLRQEPIVVEIFPPKPAKKPGTLRFADLRRTSCRYVVSGRRPEDFFFCGEAKTRGSYCAEHAALCYVPLSREKRPERSFKLTARNNGP